MSRPIEKVLDACGGAQQQTDGSWLTNCPVHGDANPSLLISEDDSGKVLIVCRSQRCRPQDVVEKWGLAMRDLFPTGDEAKAPPGAPPTGALKAVASYDYLDENGVLLFQVLKYAGKPRFRQRRPSHKEPPASLWIWDTEGVRKVPYRLPEVAAAVHFGHRIYVVEGEKDADTLAHLGLVATTNAGGAGSWPKECADALEGAAEVVILPDNDPAGERHAQEVRKSLQGRARRVRTVRLPDLAPKGDVSDWVAGGGTRDKLEELASAGPLARGWIKASSALTEQRRDTEWIVDGLLSRPSLAMVSGDADSFKSWCLTQLCVAAAVEARWLGQFHVDGRRAMLVTADEDRDETLRKVDWVARGCAGPDGPDLKALGDNFLLWCDDLSFDDEASFAALREDVEDFQPDVIVVDHLRVCFEGEENSSEFARKVKMRGRELHRAHPCAVVWIHHVRKLSKESEMNKARQRVRGTGGLVQSFDHHLAFERDEDRDVALVTVDRNKKGRRLPPFSICVRIVDALGIAGVEYGGDSKEMAGTSAAPGKVLQTLRSRPGPWAVGEVEDAMPDSSRSTVKRGLSDLVHRGLALKTGGGSNTRYEAAPIAGEWPEADHDEPAEGQKAARHGHTQLNGVKSPGSAGSRPGHLNILGERDD